MQDDLDAEDACGANAANTQDRWLAEAGMVLRDPPAMHMLAAEVVDTLYRYAAPYTYNSGHMRPSLSSGASEGLHMLCYVGVSSA